MFAFCRVRFATSGDIPAQNSGCSAVLLDELRLFVFGGFLHQSGAESSNRLFLLDLCTMHWTEIAAASPKLPTPRHKLVGWEHDDKYA